MALANLNTPATPAQIVSAEASVAQAELALANLKSPATPAQIASADAAVGQAELALAGLNATATLVQIASADASVAQAEFTLANLNATATPAKIASSNAAVTQAENNLGSAQGAVETAWASQMIARTAFCQSESAVDPPVWLYVDPICPVSDEPLSETSKDSLLEMIADGYLAAQANSLLIAHRAHRSAVDASEIAAIGLAASVASLAALDDPPTAAELAPATESLAAARAQRTALDLPPSEAMLAQAADSLKAAREQRAALDDPPTAGALAQAEASLNAAREQRAALDDPPTAAQGAPEASLEAALAQRAALDEAPTANALAQAEASLNAAVAQRAALDDPPTAGQIAQAEASLHSARGSLNIAVTNRNDLVEGALAGVLMFGDAQMWREFRDSMAPGEDVRQLEQNLVALEYADFGSMSVDDVFDAATADAITSMQADMGLIETGRIALGAVIFLPGASVVASSPTPPSLGVNLNSGTVMATLTPIERVEMLIGATGDVTVTSESLQQVSTTIEVEDQDLIELGSEVQIELPDETVVSGAVVEIGSIAVVPQVGQGAPYLEVSVAIDGAADLYEWTGAPVTVSITKQLAANVLAVPVTSLLALLGGGYAVEVHVSSVATRLVAVEAGVYADGWVEVTGVGLEVGAEVVVPR